jgi:hypothetical protein
MVFVPVCAVLGTIKKATKLPFLSTVTRRRRSAERRKEMSTISPGVHPLPVIITFVPGSPEVAFSVKVGDVIGLGLGLGDGLGDGLGLGVGDGDGASA